MSDLGALLIEDTEMSDLSDPRLNNAIDEYNTYRTEALQLIDEFNKSVEYSDLHPKCQTPTALTARLRTFKCFRCSRSFEISDSRLPFLMDLDTEDSLQTTKWHRYTITRSISPELQKLLQRLNA